MTTNIKSFVLLCFGLVELAANSAQAGQLDDYATYCRENGGVVQLMPAEIQTAKGMEQGLTKAFCNYFGEDFFAAVGLETLATDKPNIAATYIQNLLPIDPQSNLFKGKHPNPSHNVCANLGGTGIGFVASGGFANPQGQSDICVFGDGSMVSGWTLIYIANSRSGYDIIKSAINSKPLSITIPR